MTYRLPEVLLSRLSGFVADQMGLHFPVERWRDLERGMHSAAQEFGFADIEECAQRLLASPLTRRQVEVLAIHLTVGETYFFREKGTFSLLEDHVFPELIRLRRGTTRRLRIWSAGCATGEESYSSAILLHKLIPDLECWNITILATDINPLFLQKALRGIYTDWSFRDTPSWVREAYFKRVQGERFQILPSIQKMVSFSHLNLAEDTYPSLSNNTNAMDVILCRNVLMYFAVAWQKKVIENLHRSLVEGGWLIVSPSETSHVLFSEFRTLNLPSAIFYRKDSQNAPTLEFLPSYVDKELTPRLPPTTFGFPEPEPTPAIFPELCESPPALAEEPRPEEVKINLYQEALTLFRQGRYLDAVEKLTFWLSQYQHDTHAMSLLARAYANQGQLVEALEWCDKAVAADKLNAGCHYLRAMILQEQAAVEDAVVSLQRTLYLDPKFAMAHFSLGNLALRQGKAKEAEKHFKNALSLLQAHPQGEILPESEGITAERLVEIIRSTICEETFV